MERTDTLGEIPRANHKDSEDRREDAEELVEQWSPNHCYCAVRLLQSVELLPRQSMPVLVKVDGSESNDPLLLEYDEAVEDATGW